MAVEDSRLGLGCLYAAYGLAAGVGIVVAGGALLLLVRFAIEGFLSGDVGPLAFAILLALVGGPASLLYLLPMIRHPDQRPPLPRVRWEAVRLPWLALSVLLGVLCVLALISTGIGLLLLFVVAFPALAVAISMHGLSGELDAGRETLRTNRGSRFDTTVDLNTIDGYRLISLGRVAIFWFSYADGGSLTRTKWFPVPVAVAPAVERSAVAAIERGTASADESETGSNPLVRPLLVGFALLFFVLVGVIGVVGSVSSTHNVRLLVPMGLLITFGVLFLVTAYYS